MDRGPAVAIALQRCGGATRRRAPRDAFAIDAQIRPARTEDAERIAALSSQLGYDVPADAYADRLQRGERRGVLVATLADRVVGWVAVSAETTFIEGYGALLEGLIVDERARGGGIGAQLVAAAEAWARDRGCKEIRVQSNVVRERAHAFYAREGYTTVKAQYQLRKPLDEFNIDADS